MKQSFLKKAMLVLMLAAVTFFCASAQTKNVIGTVVDSQGKPLTGVTVMEKGTRNGTMTDNYGKYSINVKTDAVLVFQCIGCETQEHTAVISPLNITLNEDREFIDELVVVGYGVQKKSDLTGAISSVKREDIEHRSITTAAQALQGKTAGVQVISNSAAPGSTPSIRVRGLSSNTDSTPLFVIDGRIGSIAGIDPNDIESMEVLKDAASAAIYGVAAGNGVILVTTRKGRGNGTISYDFQYTTQSLAKVPRMMNSEQWIEYFTEGGLLDMNNVNQNWDFKTNTDWTKAAFGPSVMQHHNVSFSSGDEKGSVFVSGSYLDNDGMIVGNADVFSRLTGMVNITRNIKPWLEIGTNNQVEYYKSRSVGEGSEYGSFLLSVLQLDPLTPVSYPIDNLPAYLQKIYDDPSMPELLGDGNGNVWAPSRFVTGENIHPFVSRDSSYGTSRGFNVNGSAYLNFKPVKGLVVTSRLGYLLGSSESYSYSNDYYYNALKNFDILSVNGSSYANTYWQWENFVNYTTSLKGGHNITAMAGISFSESRSFGLSGSVKGSGWDETHTSFDSGFLKDDPTFLYFAYKTKSSIMNVSGGEDNISRKLSYFARANYDYKGKYYIQASVRVDGADSSVLPPTNRYGVFPAVAAGWNISQEEFMAPTKSWLNQLKFRGSWGKLGSTAGLGGYRYSTVIANTGSYPTGTGTQYVPGYAPSATGNPELGWEKSEQTNIGIDARFLKDRLTFNIDWYDKTTKDLIVSGAKASTVVGNTASPLNSGNITNTGIEFELGWQDSIGDLHYGIRANAATLKNRVSRIHETIDRIDGATFHTYGAITAFEVGHPAWYFYGYKFDKIDPITGTPLFVDINEDGQIDDSDKTEIGKGMPDLTYGITINLAWKGFDFVAFGTGSAGNDIYCCLNRSDYILNKLTYFTEDRWTPTHTNATQPKAGANDMDKFMVSSASVFDGSFFKIKQMQLGYTLPESITKKVHISNLRLYVSLDDWFTFCKYPGFDPEVNGGGSSLGVDKGNYPTSKKAVFGLSLKF